MASEDEESSALEISSPETQFIERDDDEETLWEVIEITGEKGKRYKVKWAGEDPKTRKPWPQSWVTKHDVTNDLVQIWKAKKAQKKKTLDRKQSIKRDSIASKKSRGSAVSRASATTRAGSSTTARRGRSSATATAVPVKAESPLLHPTNGKRKHSPARSDSSISLPEISVLLETSGQPPSRKKRKLADHDEDERPRPKPAQKQSSSSSKPTHSKEMQREEEESSGTRVVVSKQGQKKAAVLKDIDPDLHEDPPVTLSTQRKRSAKRNVHDGDKSDDDPPSKKSKGKARAVDQSDQEMDELIVPKSKKPLPSKAGQISRNGVIKPPKKHRPPSPIRTHPRRPQKDNESDHESDRDTHPPTPPPRKKRFTISERNAKAKTPPRPRERTPTFSHPLTPNSRMRLAEFDAQVMALDDVAESTGHTDIQTEHTVGTEDHPGSFMYGESDIDPVAGGLMYPEDEGNSPPKSQPKNNGIRRDSTLLDSPYNDTVPETEQESQSQERAGAELARRLATPSRASMISKMKPRTPRSAGGSMLSILNGGVPGARRAGGSKISVLDDAYDAPQIEDKLPAKETQGNGNQKALRPIPVLSPSKFAPHLPSSLGDSTIENPDQEEEPEEPMSSIEQFESPVKKGPPRGQKKAVSTTNGLKKKSKYSPMDEETDFWAGSVVLERGQKLAEAAKLARQQPNGRSGVEGGSDAPKRTINQIIASKSKSKSKSRSATRSRDQSVEPRSPIKQTMTMNPSQSPPQFPSQIHPESLEQLEDSFVDYGGGDSGVNDATQQDDDEPVVQRDVVALAEEEEESTQDILHELEVQRAISEVWDPPTPEYHSNEPLEDRPDVSMGRPSSPAPESQDNAEPLAETPVHKAPSPAPASRISGRASRSRSRSRAVSEAQAKVVKDKDAEMEIPPTATTHQDFSQDTNQTSADPTDDEPRHIGVAMSLLNLKSDEINKLEVLLVEERTKNEGFIQTIASLREELERTRAQLQTPQLQLPNPELESQLSETRSLLTSEKEKWEEERLAFNVSLKTANERTDLADKDCQFFREQYGKASAYVTLLQSEKKDLEKELSIAQLQADNGVASIKTMFDQRLKSLEQDRNSWRRTAEFIIEKDRRTNDEIRKQAADEPELRARCARLLDKLEIAKDQLGTLEESVEEKEKEVERLESELTTKKDEIVRLNIELNEVKTKLERIGKAGMASGETQGSMDNAHEFVYRCQWRSEDGSECCEAVCLTIEELEDHLFTGGHLRRE